MKDHLKSRETKLPCEINWKIREIFSEAALASFSKEIAHQYLAIEKNSSMHRIFSKPGFYICFTFRVIFHLDKVHQVLSL